ncbi:hypothetical protein L1887_32154 [Cichorium endivia]|nr:hypothetical protein L1887_32154 [Cichorium endivia]
MAEKLHPALMITNIRNFILITLEMESSQYTSWAELFRIHYRAFQVIDRIEPKAAIPPPSTTEKVADKPTDPKAVDPKLWNRLDAIVIQWIYSTISNDLLHTILKPKSSAAQAWATLEIIFQDNQNERALYLEHKLITTKLANFANCSAYCQALKVISDQLSNVGAPVTNQRLVLQLIAGLTESYEGIALMIQQTMPLPDFYEARSRLILEETRKENHATQSANTDAYALNTQTRSPQPTTDYNNATRGRGRGRNNRGRGRGRRGGNSNGGNRGQSQQFQQWTSAPSWQNPPPWASQPSW